jgi:conjugal transfer pilus assembly protein TraV
MSVLKSLSLLSFAGILMSGCSTVLPYSSDFSCKNDDHGRCIEPLNAYALAVSETQDTVDGTMDIGEPVSGSDRRRTRSWRSDDREGQGRSGPQQAPRGNSGNQLVSNQPVAPYEGYQQALYRELTGLIDQPETPMLTPPKTVRTLILPYSDGQATGTLYMPRFVYSIVEAPQFIMGNYLARQRQNDLASFLAAGRLGGEDDSVFYGTDGPAGGPVDLRLPEPSGPELPPVDADPTEGLLPALTSLQAASSRDGGAN